MFPSSPVPAHDIVAMRERALMAAAFHRGIRGLELISTGTVPTPAEVVTMTSSIRALLTMKALAYVTERAGAAASAEDLSKFIETMRVAPVTTEDKFADRRNAMFRGLQALAATKKEGVESARPGDSRPINQPAESACGFSAS